MKLCRIWSHSPMLTLPVLPIWEEHSTSVQDCLHSQSTPGSLRYSSLNGELPSSEHVIDIHLHEIRERVLGVLLHSYVSPAPRSPWSLQTSGINLPFNSLFQQLGPSSHTLWKDQLPASPHGKIFWGCIYSHWLLSPWWVMSTAFSICPSWTLTAPSNKIVALLQVPRKQLTLECETT